MQTRLILVLASAFAVLSTTAHAETDNKIRWGVPLEYTTQADQVSNTDILPRGNNRQPVANETPTNTPPITLTTEDNSTPPTAEDIAVTEERLNNEVRILWDEIEKAEKQQQQATDIKILPFDKTKPTPDKNTSKTKPKTKTNTAADIKAEKERIDALLRSTKDKNGKIIALPKDKLDKIDKADKSSKTSKTDKANKTDKADSKILKTTPSMPVVALPTPTPKPVLTRKQVLEEEIAREKAALKSAQTQLMIAKKRGNAAQIQKLTTMIKDRELNVQAISRELSR